MGPSAAQLQEQQVFPLHSSCPSLQPQSQLTIHNFLKNSFIQLNRYL